MGQADLEYEAQGGQRCSRSSLDGALAARPGARSSSLAQGLVAQGWGDNSMLSNELLKTSARLEHHLKAGHACARAVLSCAQCS